MRKETKSRKFGIGCQKISPKLRFCFFPETETLHFRKIEFFYCVFLERSICTKQNLVLLLNFLKAILLFDKKIGLSEVYREPGNECISGWVTQRRTTIGVRLEVGPLVEKFNRKIVFYLLFSFDTKSRWLSGLGCQEISSR